MRYYVTSRKIIHGFTDLLLYIKYVFLYWWNYNIINSSYPFVVYFIFYSYWVLWIATIISLLFSKETVSPHIWKPQTARRHWKRKPSVCPSQAIPYTFVDLDSASLEIFGYGSYYHYWHPHKRNSHRITFVCTAVGKCKTNAYLESLVNLLY